MKRHMCVSVMGALKNWKKAEWESVAKSNNMNVVQAQAMFWNYADEGKLVIPMGECDNFDYKEGCKGHETNKA